jgi:hypothetical protein
VKYLLLVYNQFWRVSIGFSCTRVLFSFFFPLQPRAQASSPSPAAASKLTASCDGAPPPWPRREPVAAPKPWPLRSPARAKPQPGPRSLARASPRGPVTAVAPPPQSRGPGCDSTPRAEEERPGSRPGPPETREELEPVPRWVPTAAQDRPAMVSF